MVLNQGLLHVSHPVTVINRVSETFAMGKGEVYILGFLLANYPLENDKSQLCPINC